MQIPNDSRQGFDAAAVAALTGVQPRRQGYFSPLPFYSISRPALLTDTLRGMDCGCHGLGFVDLNAGTNEGNLSVLGAISTGVSFVPVAGPIASSAINTFTQAVDFFRNWLGIGAGRIEADAIVPTQNNIAARLDQITNDILIGQTPTLTQLQGYYRELWQTGVAFMEFVLMPEFTDRRASGQALNTIMPYIDGTCGYPVPLGMTINGAALNENCLTWGDGTIGGPGANGMMGAVARAIQSMGGSVPALPGMVQSANSGFQVSSIPPGNGNGEGGPLMAGLSGPMVALGIAALFLFSKRRG